MLKFNGLDSDVTVGYEVLNIRVILYNILHKLSILSFNFTL